MRIKNKTESNQYIRRKNLNTVPEIIVPKHEVEAMKKFFETHSANLYVLRDGSKTSSKYFYIKTFSECESLLNEYENLVIVAVSVKGYKKQLLLGTAQFQTDNGLNITCTTDASLDHRTIYGGAEFNLKTDIFDKRLDEIPCFDKLYEYIHNNDLYDHIVEFTIFDRKVGTKKDYIVINEVRDY